MNMKKGEMLLLIIALTLFSIAGVFAAPCNLEISMVNQDPYPAIQGEEARIVFQIDGIENPECGRVEFELVENYPISLMPNQQKTYSIEAGTFQKNFKSFFLAPFKVKISEEALNGDNQIEVRYKQGSNIGYITKDFYLNIEDTRADFEVYVKNYDSVKRTITFEILNIASVDVEALTIEIPKQENIQVKGANRNIVGDLDSNEYTTAEFEATPTDGTIKLLLHYSDQINERRTIEEEVIYESEYFQGLLSQEKKSPIGTYIFLFIVLALIVYWIIRRKKKREELKKKLHKSH